MDNEKYGIELELITNKFKQKIQEVKNAFKGVSDKKINVNANTAQIQYLKKQIGELTADLQANAKAKFWNESETLKAQAQLEKLTNQYNKLISKQNEVQSSSSKSSANISKSIDRMTSKIKRFGLSLLSIRSIFSLVSRASSAYLAQDTELADKLQSVWVGLGALLAPIIEAIVNILAKAVGYINIFIEALTGVNLLAKASAKSMKAAAGSAKALNKALAGFDELTNLDTDAGGGTGGIGGLAGNLADYEDLDLNWADKIRNFGKWVGENKEAVLTFLSGVALGLEGIKLASAGLTLTGGILLELGAMIYVAKKIDDKYKIDEMLWKPLYEKYGFEYKGNDFSVAEWWIRVKIGFNLVVDTFNGLNKIFKPIQEAGAKIGKELLEGIYKPFIENDIVQFVKKYIFDPLVNAIKTLFGIQSPSKVMAELGGYLIDGLVLGIQGIWDKAKIHFENFKNNVKVKIDEIVTNIKSLFEPISSWINNNVVQPISRFFSNLWDGVKNKFNSVWNSILNAFSKGGQIFNGLKEGIVNSFKTIVNSLIRGLNKAISVPFNSLNNILNRIKNVNIAGIKPFDWVWTINVPQIPQLAVGTSYVPEDQLAMIHKGEAVIPKKFNSQEYFGGTNDETNELLKELINKVDGIEINPYTTIRDVGKASLSYINSKSRQLGESVVI